MRGTLDRPGLLWAVEIRSSKHAFKYGAVKSPMTADPTGNIRSFCSEDALR